MDEQETPGERVERFRAVYDATYDDVSAYCRRRAAAPAAEDAVAETFTVAWRRLDDMPALPGARPWLFGVARRVLANQRRGDHRRQRLHLRLIHDATPAAGANTIAALGAPGQGDELADVLGALTTLSDDDQELLRLVAWEELDHTEVAMALDIAPGTVAVRLHRARKRLMKSMGVDGQVRGRRATTADTTTGKEQDR